MKKNEKKRIEFFDKTPVYVITSIVLLGLLLLSILISVGFGSVKISIKEIYEIIIYRMLGIGNVLETSDPSTIDIVWLIRLPRIILAIAVGMGLSVSGLVMQAIVKNPLADPYVLGVSSGASLGATLAILLGVGSFLGPNYVGIAAFIGAFGVSIGVITMANIKGKSNSTKLLLSGMALSTLCSAFASFVVYFADSSDGIRTVTYWMMGSLSGANWDSIKFILPIVFLSTIFFVTQYRTLNLMLLGDEISITLGKNLHNYRLLYLIISSLNIGIIVYASGVIGFVGLIIPHVVRMIFGTDHKKITLITALVGSIFLIWMDVLSRVLISGSELPIGIIISMIGAPVFIYLMINKSYGFGGGE